MTAEAGSGHPTSCMSCAEIMAALFFEEMRWDPKDPSGADADVFVLSKGHAAPILWAALKEAGAIQNDLLTLRQYTSPLEGHPTPTSPWVRLATGSLGQGLSAAAGMAWARRADGAPGRVFCLLGDGEIAEGSVWEAAAFASFNRLTNLVRDRGREPPGPERAHDVRARHADLRRALPRLRLRRDGRGRPRRGGRAGGARARVVTERPQAIIARTLKGKGVSFLENKDGWHGKPVKKG
ncbi:MAG: 1-deoxy-D-xylulose-5-phosphate synthase N-terminal domain-containing protein, partial [Candidatus Rokuibacteriota bacterium]